MKYEVALEVKVLAADGVAPPAKVAPPRHTPELSSTHLDAVPTPIGERVGSATVVRLPFPYVSTVLAVLFSLIALAALVRGTPWSDLMGEEAQFGVVAVSGFLAFMTMLVLATTCRRIEIRESEVLLRRGLVGLGFQLTIPISEIAGVESASPGPTDSPAYYKVGFRMKSGGLRIAANRLKDPVRVRALERVLEKLLALQH